MAEPKPQTPASPRTPTPGGSGDAFAIWLHGALRSLSGAVADEPIPEALRRLAEGDAPHSAPASGVAGADRGPTLEVRHAEAAADRSQEPSRRLPETDHPDPGQRATRRLPPGRRKRPRQARTA